MMEFVSDRIENDVVKGENSCYMYFSFSHNIFKRLLSLSRLNV